MLLRYAAYTYAAIDAAAADVTFFASLLSPLMLTLLFAALMPAAATTFHYAIIISCAIDTLIF